MSDSSIYGFAEAVSQANLSASASPASRQFVIIKDGEHALYEVKRVATHKYPKIATARTHSWQALAAAAHQERMRNIDLDALKDTTTKIDKLYNSGLITAEDRSQRLNKLTDWYRSRRWNQETPEEGDIDYF